ncbi:zincin [Setomelanomma holmii]|uniref:Zincin n=1 Tax=Setomelanomma holmii TaxID=210430 RepID=A0A9P4LTM0_9PLEO|nr:zincin [Setomelanomma holmii]
MRLIFFSPIFIFFTPTLCGRVLFNQCDDTQKQTLTNALEDVQFLSQKAAEQSEGGQGKFHAWFGQPGGQKTADESINTRYHKFARVLSNVPKKDVMLDCSGKAGCCSAGQGGVPACGDLPGDDFINICSGFWRWHMKQRVYELPPPKAPTNQAIDTNYRTQGYVMLHELLHSQYGALDVKDTVKDPFGKTYECKGYGHVCVLKYALKNATNARRNADTYALFALAAYYGIDNFQTDPDLVTP